MENKEREKYWVYGEGDVTITFPDKKNEKAQDFKEIMNKKKELNKNEEH